MDRHMPHADNHNTGYTQHTHVTHSLHTSYTHHAAQPLHHTLQTPHTYTPGILSYTVAHTLYVHTTHAVTHACTSDAMITYNTH